MKFKRCPPCNGSGGANGKPKQTDHLGIILNPCNTCGGHGQVEDTSDNGSEVKQALAETIVKVKTGGLFSFFK